MRLFSDRPQLRFLLRACGLLIVMLVLWWFLLLDPLLGWVRISGDFVLGVLPGAADGTHITVKPDGNWMLRVPLPAAASSRGDLKKVRSIQMETLRDKVALFTVALPLYWAFVLAAPGKSLWRALLYGSAIIAAIMPLAVAIHAVAAIRTYFHISSTPAVAFLWETAGYLNTEVLPYMVPLFLSLWLNRELRAQIFSFMPAEPRRDSQLTRREKKRQRRRS
jgi:hypothetical protein